MTSRSRSLVLAIVSFVTFSACSSPEPEPSTSGGAPNSGGDSSSAGLGGAAAGSSTGGVSGSAGDTTSGGALSGGSAGTSVEAGAGGAGGAGGNAGSAGTGTAGVDSGGVAGVGGGGDPGGAAGAAGTAGSAGAAMAGSGGMGGTGNPPLVARADVLRLTRLVADHYLASFGTNYDKSWIRSTFYTGLMAAYRTTADAKYLSAARTWGAAGGWIQPTTASIDSNGEPRHADNQTCFQSYAEMYLLDPVPANDVMLRAATTVFDSMVAAPRTGRSEWSWCDALYMAPAAMVRAGVAKNQPAYLSLMNTMFWDTKAYLYDPTAHLFWRDNARRNTSFWSRGNGWVFAGIARILDYLPATDARRADYENLLREMAEALRPLQNTTDGFWRSDLRNPNAYPNPESSGTAFFLFGMAWGIHHGVLNRATYEPVVLKAWQGLVTTALTSEGLVGWVQGPAHMPGAAERMGTNDYAAGAFLLAAEEISKL